MDNLEDQSSGPGSAAHGISPAHFYDRTDWLSFGCTSLLAFAVYLFSLSPEVQLEDSGIYVTGAVHWGVPTVPGYPVWTIYAALFAHLLPISNFAWRVAVSSAVAAALACGLIALIVSRGAAMIAEGFRGINRLEANAENWLRIVCGCVAGMAFGLDGCVWERVGSAGPWPLTLLLFATVLSLLFRWRFASTQMRHLYAAMLIYGLGLTNSQSLVAVAPGIAFIVLLENQPLGRDFFAISAVLIAILCVFLNWNYDPMVWKIFTFIGVVTSLISIGMTVKTRRLLSSWKSVLLCGLFISLGFSTILLVPLASMTNPPMNWGYPRTVDGFWHVLSRGQYERIHPTDIIHEPAEFLMQLGIYLHVAATDLGVIYLVLAALPFCFLLRMRTQERKWIFELLGIFLWLSVFMAVMLNQSKDRASVELGKIFFAASHLILAIWSGYGLAILGVVIHARRTGPKFPNLPTLPEGVSPH